MKQWKKGMAVILAFAVVIIGLNISPRFAEAVEAPQFFADDVIAEPGSEIEIPIKISGNTGIMGLGISFGFDKQVLTPVDDVKQTSLLVGQFNNTISNTLKDGTDTFNVLWQGTDNMYENGELFTLKFRVADNASGSTAVALTLIEDETYYGVDENNMPNVAVECKEVKVTVKEAAVPDKTAEPTQEPKPTEEPKKTPEPTKEPDDPTWTDEPIVPGEYWDGKPVPIYLYYYSDSKMTESVNGYSDDVYVEVDGNGEYAISYTAKTSTYNIDRLNLSTFETLSFLPAGITIVPTKLQVGEKTYAIDKCSTEASYLYGVDIRDLYYDIDNIAGKVSVPVSAGDLITVYFRIEGMSKDGTMTIPTPVPTDSSATEQPSSPTNTPDGQTPATAAPNVPGTGNVPGTQNPIVNNPPSVSAPAFSLPAKVSLRSVKTAGKKKLKVAWRWSVDQDGYQIQYAQNRKFTKKKKTVNISPYYVDKTLSKLVSKKTYYVRVRACKYYIGKKYYGPWSNVKKCKVK